MNRIKIWFVRWAPVIVPIVYLGMRVVAAPLAHAIDQPPPPPVTDQADLAKLMCNIVSWFFWIVIVISVIMILYAAYTYVTAASDQEKTSKARRTLTYAAVGIAVAVIAAGFPAIVSSIIPNEPNVSLMDTCSF